MSVSKVETETESTAQAVSDSGSAPCSLVWVSAVEASSWPRGIQVLKREHRETGDSYSVINYLRPDYVQDYAHPRITFTFARLE
jgi:hypothetical protein